MRRPSGLLGLQTTAAPASASRIEVSDVAHLCTGGTPARRVLGVGGAEHIDAGERPQAGDDADQDLRAGRGGDHRGIAHAVHAGGGRAQGRFVGRFGQAGEHGVREGRDRVGDRVDAGREVDQRLGG